MLKFILWFLKYKHVSTNMLNWYAWTRSSISMTVYFISHIQVILLSLEPLKKKSNIHVSYMNTQKSSVTHIPQQYNCISYSTFQSEIRSLSHGRKWNHWCCLTLGSTLPHYRQCMWPVSPPSTVPCIVTSRFPSWFNTINSLLPFWQGAGGHGGGGDTEDKLFSEVILQSGIVKVAKHNYL